MGSAYVLADPDAAAIGSAAQQQAPLPEAARPAECERLDQAMAAAMRELDALSDQLRVRIGVAQAGVFDAHSLFLQDPALLGPMHQAITAEGRTAESSVSAVLEATAAELATLPDPYVRGRSDDLRDVSRRVLRVLAGDSNASGPRLPAMPTILVARDLTPSTAAGLQPERVRGIVLEEGTATAHAAILVRGLGIPLVVGAATALSAIKTGVQLIVDGISGTVLVEPSAAACAAYQQRIKEQVAAQARSRDLPRPPYNTADGHHVGLLANASSVAEARLAVENGAEGVGVLRTEFLLATLGTITGRAPDEEALCEAYAVVLREMGGRTVVVRAMDAGGDKPFPFLAFGQEANPFLGWRGTRVLLDEPQLFAAQTRALLRAASRCGADIRIMFPMITTVDEFVRARRLVEAVCAEQRPALAGPLQIGAMIEVPAAALIVASLAREADFFSLGTNDLVQYTLACDRGNPRVAALCRFQHPAVLRLVDMTVRAAHGAQRPVGVCGEAAGDMLAVPLLVGLGVDDLSVEPARLPAVRAQLLALNYRRLHELATKACALAGADEVAELLDREGVTTGA